MKTSWENVTVDNSPMGMYLAQPEVAGAVPAIIVVQNQDGVAEFTQEMTRRVAAAGYVGIAPQFYHREGEPKTPERTASIKNSRNDANVMNDIHATINFLKGCATADTSRLGIVGFCMGGRIAFLGAAATTLIQSRRRFLRRRLLLAMGRPPGAGKHWRPMFAARSKATSASSTRIRRRTKCASSTPSSHAWAKTHEFFFYPDTHHGFNRSGWKDLQARP